MKSSIDLRIAEIEKSLKEAKKEKLIHDALVEEMKVFAKELLPRFNVIRSVLSELKWKNFQLEVETFGVGKRKNKSFQEATFLVFDVVGQLKNEIYIDDKEDFIDVLAGEDPVENIERLKEIGEIIFNQTRMDKVKVPQKINVRVVVNQEDVTMYLDSFKNEVDCKISVVAKSEKFKVYVE